MMGSAFWPQCGGQRPKFQLKTLILISSDFLCAGVLFQIACTKLRLDHNDQWNYDVHLLLGDLSYVDGL